MKKSKTAYAKQMKLLSDIVWGWDLGKIGWITSILQWNIMLRLFMNNFIVLHKMRKNVTGDEIDSVIGYAFIVPVCVRNEMDLIANERRCSHFEKWKLFGNKEFFYLSEIILHSDYRNTKEFLKIFNSIVEYCVENNISFIYTTAVSEYSRKLLRNKKLLDYVELLEVKEEQREVYKINVLKYIDSNSNDK